MPQGLQGLPSSAPSDLSDSEFGAIQSIARKRNAEFREHWRRKLREERLTREINAEPPRSERRNRPIKVKRFAIE